MKLGHIVVPAIGLVFLSLLLLAPGFARDLRCDPATGKIRVIYIGDAIGVPNPFPILSQDPTLSCTAVYACTIHQTVDMIRKSVRTYMPRTYSQFLQNDVIILSDANKDAFRPEHFSWMKKGVLEGGQGLVMIGGAESFAEEGGYPSWKPTGVADVLPCDMIPTPPPFSGGYLRIIDWSDEFIKSLPFKQIGSYGVFHGSNNIQPRPRAKLVAELIMGTMKKMPFLMWWDIGKGRTMAESADWTPAGGNMFMRWKYWGDYAINMCLFLAGQKLPDDIETVYAVRHRLRETEEALNMLYNMVDIVEKFGGSTVGLNKMIVDIQAQKKKALQFYVQAKMEDALAAFSKTLKMCDDTMDQAIKARNEAAFWIFFTEWCVVTGTSLFVGAMIWILMVKRRLYKEVAVTRMRPS